MQNAIPLAGASLRTRHALNVLLACPALLYDTELTRNDTYIEFVAHSPSKGQAAVWSVALSLAGFGTAALFDALSTDPESAAAVVEAVRLVAA